MLPVAKPEAGRGQKQDGAGHLIRLGVAPQGHLLQPGIQDFFITGQGAGEFRVGQSRQQGIDPDIIRPALQRKSLGHVDDGALGDGINAPFVSRPDPVNGCHVDDGAAAIFLHQLTRIHGHEEVAAYIDFNGFSERARVRFRNMAVIRICRGHCLPVCLVGHAPAGCAQIPLRFAPGHRCGRQKQSPFLLHP